ncbi:Protein of unknown function [Rhizobiales bacterium GAS191]|jgi:Kef-type K+ transport system membrane component KefB|nr:Protein of unknown function [Rhizobiales bacterium GAS191]
MFTGIGLIAFCCIFGAALVGFLLGVLLPEHHLSDATQRVVQTTMNVVGILAALVLGLLIAGTKTNFDTRSKEIEQFAANLTLLDRELAHFGEDAKEMRDELRAFTARKIALTWPKERGTEPVMHDAETVRMLDDVEERLRALTPANEARRAGRVSALRLADELKQTGRLLAVQEGGRMPRPFLIVVIFWLSMLFLSYAVFAPLNATVIGAMLICAVSVSIAVNLTYDMDRPFTGFIRVSPLPMQQALEQMQP